MSVAHGEHLEVLEDEHGTSGRSMQWWGMILFIASEALIFANFIATYLYLEIRNWNTGPTFKLPSDITYPIINTIILICSSFPAHFAGRGIVKGNQRQLKIGLALTIIMGVIFLGGQVFEYSGLFGISFTPDSSVFGSVFFTLTGFHGLHVTIGVLFLLICLIRSTRGDFTAKKHFAIQAAEMYWHFVDVVWIIVFSMIYLAPLVFQH